MPLAHGVGLRSSLPIEFWQFAWAAIAALAVSFLALGVLWTSPRLAAAAEGTALPVPNTFAELLRMVARLATLLVFLLVIVAALVGVDASRDNIAPIAIYVAFWVGLQVLAAVTGDVWRTLSPFETIADAVFEETEDEAKVPGWSWWLAPAGMLGFLILELVHPSGDSPRIVGLAMVVYTMVMLTAAARWGPSWLRRGESFAVLFTLIGAMAPFHIDDEGRRRLRVPLSGLSTMTFTTPMLALTLIILGGTTFDGLSATTLWVDIAGRNSGWNGASRSLLGLIYSIALVTGLYEIGVRFAAKVTGETRQVVRLDFAPSLVPIVFGYTVAHYALLLIDDIQSFVFLFSDPLGQGWNVFGMADNTLNTEVVSSATLGWIQVLAIVVGHVAAVAVAHDRAIERFSKSQASRSQYAMLAVMVLYSVVGLWLLFNA